MRRGAVSFVGVTALVAAANAAATTLPVPVPEVPPVEVPPVVLPLPTAPLPAPAPTPPAKLKTPPVSTPAVEVPTGGASGVVPGSGTGSSSSSAPSSSGSSTRAARPNVRSLRTTRTWIGGTKRATRLTFFLPDAARVYFTVVQVSPICRPVGHFSYVGHAGFNRVRFDGRLGRRELEPGTYKISARTRSGRTIPRVTLVVVESATPTSGELAVARAANVCSSVTAASASAAASNTGSAANADNVERSLQPKVEPLAGGIPAEGANSHSGVLAASLERTAEALRPIVVVLLALAIVLLGIASLPRTAVPDPRMHDLLARHRVDLAGAGAAALVAVALLFFL